jgi:hypothetical protein
MIKSRFCAIQNSNNTVETDLEQVLKNDFPSPCNVFYSNMQSYLEMLSNKREFISLKDFIYFIILISNGAFYS